MTRACGPRPSGGDGTGCHSVQFACGDGWRRRQDSNLHTPGQWGEPAFQAGAIPFRSLLHGGGTTGNRTPIPAMPSQCSPFEPWSRVVVEDGVEPSVTRLSGEARTVWTLYEGVAGAVGIEPTRKDLESSPPSLGTWAPDESGTSGGIRTHTITGLSRARLPRLRHAGMVPAPGLEPGISGL